MICLICLIGCAKKAEEAVTEEGAAPVVVEATVETAIVETAIVVDLPAPAVVEADETN